MEEVAKRIKELIDKEELSNSEFAKKIDINPSIISHILSGRNKPSLQIIDAIKESFTNVNLDYLISGKGSIYNEFTNVKSINPDTDQMEQSPITNSLFPMEGIRHASIPGSAVQTKSKVSETNTPEKDIESSAPPPTQQKEKVLKTSQKGESDKEEIERIVIFYKNGRFKTYRPEE